MLTLLRRISSGDDLVRSGGLGAGALGDLHCLSALTVGLLGYGRIGQCVANAVEALGGHVIIHDPYIGEIPPGRRLVSADEMFATAEVLSVYCPLTPETRGLVSQATLDRMPLGSYLVNTSRGPIVVLADVLAALREGRLGGAGLDVFDPEPPRPRPDRRCTQPRRDAARRVPVRGRGARIPAEGRDAGSAPAARRAVGL
jgi:D-3-phosphoglycerate dehydrogenase / 2-oxoglutarate reductase